MLSVKSSGGSGGPALSMSFGNMYYPAGTTTGKPSDLQQIYHYYDIVYELKSFICFDEYTPIDIPVTRNGG